ncbi:ATP-binding cassette domain-containing protein [Paenarthrobacter sp. Z7-10]|uniref:ABC transporter ATP-binding protein n=1 Tax=Paenarthrobacter sp. Z7-10 TaxID=2787635 RepID=UPI0022A8FDF9|nr:ATP-binding cassette domain-containing protein [Paenarthrobacter sp. Z7-10]MCZ2401867.1 ATP-binding cassette domain-containing protein [Paenarthrobacter sp. Z7-10]
MAAHDDGGTGSGGWPAAVSAKGWGFQHAGRSSPAVHDLTLEIAPGERVLLLGPSGAGKSTLLHALAGVLGSDEDAAESGSLLVDGSPPSHRRGRSGLMQQDPEAQVVLSRVGDDVAFGAENLAVPPAEIWRRAAAALDAVGLDLPLDHPTSSLSGGQKQRLGLAGMLAMRPGLLLLDEPTANLDPAGVLEVRDAVLRMLTDTGATLVVVEHRVPVWLDVVDRIVVLAPGSQRQPGGVLLDGPPARVLEQSRAMLISAGIWVPDYLPVVRPRQNSSSGEVLLTARDLAVSRASVPRRRHRGYRPAPVPTASGINIEVCAGAALGITGPNGAGKSTVALTLGGLLPITGGQLSAADPLARGAGQSPFDWTGPELVGRIGNVFQEPEHQFVTGRVLDELAFGPRMLGQGTAGVEELLVRLRLEHLAEANPYTLSGGEKRRLSVATVLATRPQILVMDEPTFGQDANTWAELATLLSELLDAGAGVVAVTHDAEFTRVLGGAQLELTAAGTPAASAVLGVDRAASAVLGVDRAAAARPEVQGEY